MSVNEDGADNSEEIDIDDISPEKLSNLFSWSEDEEGIHLEVSEGEKREPSFGSLARDDAPTPSRDSVFEKDESSPKGKSSKDLTDPPSFPNKPSVNQTSTTKRERKVPRSSIRNLSLFGKVKEINEKRKARKEEASLGIDLSSPKRGQVLDPPTAFQELLQPLSDSELILLQKDVQADESVYVKIDKARSRGNLRQRWAVLFTTIAFLVLAISFGEQYLTETLPSANSSWLPADLSSDIRGQIVFALGLLLPIISLFSLSEGFRLLLVFFSSGGMLLAIRSFVTLALAALSFVFLVSGSILLSLIVVITWWLTRKILNHPLLQNLRKK